MAETNPQNRAVGYIRVGSIEDQLDIDQQMKLIRAHCLKQDTDLMMVFVDEGRHSQNFKGPAWTLLESFLMENKGKVSSVVVSDPDRLSSDLGLLLLKHQLRSDLGVTIAIAGGRQMGQGLGFSLN